MSDYTVGDTLHFMFTTRRFTTGVPFALAGGVISAYENESLTQITAGITLGADHDGVTGLNLVTVVASGANGFEAGKDYHLVITTGTVDSVSVVGEVVGRFTLSRSAAAAVIGAAGAGLTAINLPDQTMNITGDITGNLSGSVGSVATGGITAASFAADAITAAKVAADVGTEIATAVWSAATRLLTAGTNIVLAKGVGVTGFNDLSEANVRTAVGLASANLDTQLAALPTAGENADQVWEEAIADHSGTVGSTAEALAAAGSAGDPWATQLPGAYGAGSAGKLIGDNVDATISSRATQTSVDDVPTNAELATSQAAADDATLAAIATAQADLDDIQTRLPAALVSGRIDASVGAMAANVLTATAIASGAITAAKFAANALDAVWSTATRLLTAGTNIVLAKGTGVTGFNDLDAAGVRTAVGLATANLDTQLGDLPTNAELATSQAAADDATIAAIAALNNLSASQVNAEVVDALATDTYAEPGQGSPAATLSIAAKINYMYKSFRNKKTQSATEWKLFADDAVTVDQKSTVSDDGTTATRGEIAAGP